MRLLLDTCVAVWLLDQYEKIPEPIVQKLVDTEFSLYISHVSNIELAIKFSKGRLDWAQPPSQIFPKLMEQMSIEPLSIDSGTIELFEGLPYHHNDPFDRLLIGQAIAHNLTIVTPDSMFLKYSVPVLWEK